MPALMRRVNEFRKTAAKGWDGSRSLQILVTGAAAFVSEFVKHALRCRRDIAWLSRACEHDFFRWVPPMAALAGMAFCLLLSCLVALTAGQLLSGS